jgi:cholesterol oxidase
MSNSGASKSGAAHAGGVAFRERMAGWFALGETDPAAGAAAGEAARSTLALEARVAIPDVRKFATDPQHAGDLGGAVTFAPLGASMPVTSGYVRLFVASSDPDLKLMVYHVTFAGPGGDHCFDGQKLVRRHSMLHGWTDTTTLFGRLYSGPDAAGTPVGAGVLRLTPSSFARQLLSFRTLDALTVVDRTRALGGFFGFFAGELIDSYLWRTRT